MITRYLLFIAVAWTFLSFKPSAHRELNITITGVRNNSGSVLVSLFLDDSGYPADASKAVRKGKATYGSDKTATIKFDDLPAGRYAAVVLHDENDNFRMDKTWIGLPKEGYGFSNNAKAPFGPPSFKQASFTHSSDKTSAISIQLRY